MSATLRAVPSRVDNLAASLRQRLPQPAAVADASETDFVRYVHDLRPGLSEVYVEARLRYALDRLANPMTREAAWADGPIALGAYETLRDLAGAS